MHIFLAVKWVQPFVNSMGLASGLIRVQLFLAVQNSSIYYLILKMCVSHDIILMYYLNYEHTSANSFTVYCTLLFFSLFIYNG